MKSRKPIISIACLGVSLITGTGFSACSGSTCVDRGNCAENGGSSGISGSSGGTSNGGEVGGVSMAGANTGGSSSGEGGGGAAGASGEANSSGEAGTGAMPCDTSKTPSTEACLVDNSYAIFVAPNGADNAAGTMSAPAATLSKAVALAAGAKFVIVCDATYDEHVNVGTGAQVYGGFSCAGGHWATEAGAPLFKPSDAGPALKIDGVGKAVVIDTVKFEVPDATVPGGTALTALVNASPNVTLQNVSLTAGAGMNGADGTLTTFSYPDANTLNGNAETVAGTGGASKTCSCQPSLSSTGGLGGSPVIGGQSGSTGQPNRSGGAGGDPSFGDCGAGSSGKKGGDGPQTAPAPGASALGTLSSTGWLPGSGTDGSIGGPGQGGGGGASLNNLGHGGGGGCGGCGGNGARAGQGGGGSIALLAIDSPVILDGSILTSKDAGNGGPGHSGQGGQQTAGGGGNAINTLNSCGGGAGGKGGDGGASGGGAGGISVGIVWKGSTAPKVTNTTTMTGKAGAIGIGGVPGTDDGIAGVTQDVLDVP